MKNLLWIALAFISLQATAQHNRKQDTKQCDHQNMVMSTSAEDAASIKTKKMTLLLDLSESQQKDIYALHLEQAKKRKAHMEEMKAKQEADSTKQCPAYRNPEMVNKMLDHKIEMKAKIKAILNPEQYAKWEKSQAEKPRKKGKKMACCKMDD